MTSPFLFVCALALINDRREVLLSQRPAAKMLAGLWEFPGGKIEDGETPEAALVREAKEELDIAIAPENLEPLTFASHAYPEFHIFMPLYVCRTWDGTPKATEGQTLAWVNRNALEDLPMPEADKPLIPFIRFILSA